MVCDAAAAQVGAEAAETVCRIGDDAIWAAARPAQAGAGHADAFQERGCADVVVALARRDEDRGGGVLVGADGGGVDLDQPVDVTGFVGLGLDLLKGSGAHAVRGVAVEAGVYRLPWAVTGRKVTPGDPHANLVDHAVDDLSVFGTRSARHGSRYQRSK